MLVKSFMKKKLAVKIIPAQAVAGRLLRGEKRKNGVS